MGPIVRRRFTVSGDVQGVGYRSFARMAARRQGLVGRVRNLPDGRVEVLAQGPPAAFEVFQGKLHEGPPFSTVAGVERTELEPADDLSDFRIA